LPKPQRDAPWILKEVGGRLGFLAIGFSRPVRPPFFDHYQQWISDNRHAGMTWIERSLELRADPRHLLANCRTIISLAYPYPSQRPLTEDRFAVSRYSQPDREDYHLGLRQYCLELVKELEKMLGGAAFRICVDSAPIMERDFAYLSGIGFVGKNNMLIIPGYGSYLFLAEILTTASIEFDDPETMGDRCGSCGKCIEACPTGALEGPFRLDASRCLSYLTIEHKGNMGEGVGEKMGDCFFGCDRCQEACPYNDKESRQAILMPSAEDFLLMGDRDFKERYGKTALARAGLNKLKRNIKALLETKGAMKPSDPS
jgi:epoxyqueuosine reductase